VIEPLSDSTIYMAYYTIAHRLSEIPVADLDRDFFDALFYGADAVDEPDERALALRAEWQYWYPVTYRFSANDLISNHLTFYLLHHAELFDPDEWPAGIVIMGLGLLEGEKMSSSKGHVVLPDTAIEEYGADTVRFFLLNSAEPWQDYDWRTEQVDSVRTQLERFWTRASDIIDDPGPAERPELSTADRWLLSRLQRTVADVTEALDGSETRTASQAVFYDFEEDLRWYRRRADLSRPAARWTLREVLETRLRLLAPFVPFLANELHEQLTGTPAEDAPWPEPDDALLDRGVEAAEAQVERLVDDIQGIQQSLRNADEDVPEADPDRIRVAVAADWKHRVFDTVTEIGADQGAVMSEVMSEPDLRERGNAVNDLVSELIEFARARDADELDALADLDEAAMYRNAVGFLGTEFDADIVVTVEADDSSAIPLRPSIDLEAA
jgi:leucyl-tRNA synthetase